MITAEQATHVLYRQLATKPYSSAGSWTTGVYRDDPRLKSKSQEFKKTFEANPCEFTTGPAATAAKRG